jgi:ankyrin repeat protein
MNGIGIKSALNRLLKIAVANGVENAIKVHIAKGDDLNARDDAGNTPLLNAAPKKQTNACRLLLENGAAPLNGLGGEECSHDSFGCEMPRDRCTHTVICTNF